MYPPEKKSITSQNSFLERGGNGDTYSVRQKTSDRRLEGAALVIVLAFLVILTGLVVGFLSSVTNEASSTAASVGAVSTRTLADAAIQLDIAQIRDATAGYSHNSDGSLNSSKPVGWSSQPGAIRTFDTTASNVATYKLYSSTSMVSTQGSYNPANDLPANSSWTANSAQWIDLNSPVSRSSGGTANTNYPVMDPAMTNTVNGNTIVDGFSINTAAPSLSGVSNAAAMPVSWIYVLQNGTLTVPSSVAGNVASFSANIPSATNPIVGRIAFWTDDETCKLNLNTASEGSFWGVPSFSTSADQAFAQYPPGASEYNRFPGHPASTCLSPVLWSFLSLSDPAQLAMPNPNNNGIYSLGFTNQGANNWDASQNALNIPAYSVTISPTNYLSGLFSNVTPRYVWGGSYGGIRSLISNSIAPNSTTNSYRLYSSVDEFFFAPTNALSATGRTNNPLFGSGFSSSVFSSPARAVSGLRFFLTTESRAPEVNPLNLPKVCLWPIPDPIHINTVNTVASTPPNNGTLYDNLIAFCSTLGTNAYYFTRYDPSSATADIAAGAVPGRNQQIYNYLRNMLDQPVPGFKGAFTSANKWTNSQSDQISTEIYDYIRSCINLCDASGCTNISLGYMMAHPSVFSNSYTVPPNFSVSSPDGVNSFTNVVLGSGSGQVVPIKIINPDGNTTMGMGRFPTIRGATLWFAAVAANEPPLMCHPDGRPIVYSANGTQISTYAASNSTIQAAYVTNVLAGQAYAVINPQHPWTTPYTNSLIINGLPAVPQYTVGGIAVLADTNPSGYKPPGVPYTTKPTPSRGVYDTTSVSMVYPIFSLSTNNSPNAAFTANMSNSASTATRTFPSYSSGINGAPMLFYTNTGCSNGTIKDLATTTTQINWYSSNSPIATALYTVYVASVPKLSASSITYPGLPFLTIQNPTNGAFTLSNANYSGSSFKPNTIAAFPVHTTAIQCAFLPHLVTVTPGTFGINLALKIGATWPAFAANATALTWKGVNFALTTLQCPNSSLLYDQELCGISSQNTSFFTPANTVILLPSTNNANGSRTNFFTFTGGTVILSLSSTLKSGATVQNVSLNFPDSSFPIPKLPLYLPSGNFTWPPGNQVALTYTTNTTNASVTTNTPFWALLLTNTIQNRISMVGGGNNSEPNLFPTLMQLPQSFKNADVATNWTTLNWITADTLESVDLQGGDPRMIASLPTVDTSFYAPNPLYGNTTLVTVNGWSEPVRNAHSMRQEGMAIGGGNYGTLLFTNGVESFWLSPVYSQFGVGLYSNLPGITIATNIFAWSESEQRPPPYLFAAKGYGSRPQTGPFAHRPTIANGNDARYALFWNAYTNGGDFDNGIGFFPDGPYMGKVDEGYGQINSDGTVSATPYFDLQASPAGSVIFSPNRMVPSPVILGSLPIGITGIGANILNSSWKTLQFSPNPNAPDATNPARSVSAGYNAANGTITNPVLPDHLLLDYFQMPVVQPYPISDPFSTAGKVNMNYQIAPFSYINRDSAMRGVLKSVMITAVDARWGYDYKMRGTNWYFTKFSQIYSDTTVYPGNPYSYNSNIPSLESVTGQWYFHYPISLSNTLAQFTSRFSQNDIFRSPSEICSLWLYPAQQPTTAVPLNNKNPVTNSAGTPVVWDSNNANITSWWYGTSTADMSAKSLTGDNIRERPYNYIYPRLTTKSNTYQIHYRVQALKQTSVAHSSDWTTWIDPAAGGITDKVVGEQRGSAVIERFIDPSNPSLPDFTTNVTSGGGITGAPMDSYYQFRVFNAKQFTP